MMRRFALAGLAIAGSVGANAQTAPVMGYRVVARFPHLTQSYTEGFFYRDGFFYEGTGIEGRSSVLVIEPASGKIIKHVDLGPQYFGEGVVDWGD
ncbi:MAG TPA: glutaminyl-peptide cyclotransferase, partial [Candidatus Acidoferrales bacterium]|nr:glutaminyl-peptide cyclotransferase [Candidatus Acidoferrales bacterium]